MYNDFLNLYDPILPLGLYVEEPLNYAKTNQKKSFVELINPEFRNVSDKSTKEKVEKKGSDFNLKFDKYLKWLKKKPETAVDCN